jgi:Fur family peroxide stress response transcriptional regulator
MNGEGRVMEMFTRVRASGLKLTPQRMAIVREIALDPTHPTAQELFERLRVTMPTMSFATVYNTLDTLSTAGLCVSLSLSPGAARFDANMQPHNHAVCDRCGLVRDVPCIDELEPNACDVDTSIGVIGVVEGFSLRTVERIYRGTCADCAREKTLEHSDKR